MHCSLFKIYVHFKFCPSVLETVDLVPARHVIDISLSMFASATNGACRNDDVFAAKKCFS
jgi:hypothetical protein